MSAIYILWLRELKRYVRSQAQIVASLGQPLLYLLVLGFGLGPVFQKAGNGSYLQFVAPGVISMTILFCSIFSGIGLLWDRQFGFLKETLVAPVPRIAVMIGSTLGGSHGRGDPGTAGHDRLLDRRVSSRALSLVSPGFCFMVLIAIVFAALGTAIGSVAAGHAGLSTDHELHGDADLLSLGSAVSADQSARAAASITRLDPLTYGVDDCAEYCIIVSHFGLALDVSLLCGIAVAFLSLGGD